jgi:putative protease
MAKILVIPSSVEEIELLKDKNIAGVIFSIKDLSVNNNLYLTINELKELIPTLNPKWEICISLNKIMHNKDLPLLEDSLKELNKLNVTKILFYDLSILNITKRLNLKLDLAIFQDHLNASLTSHNFYYKQGVNYSVVTNDITLDEILEIKKCSPIKVMLMVYGYLPIFYSRRYLVSNYLEYLKEYKDKSLHYLVNINDYYPIIEEDYGTTIYSPLPVNLIKYLDKLKELDYLILNSNNICDNEFLEILDKYLTDYEEIGDVYEGFINTKTIYKVKNNE